MTPVALLLADPSACLRALVLRDLLGRPADDAELLEVAAARRDDPLVTDLVARQRADGSWEGRPIVTARALARLGYLGFGGDLPAVRAAAGYLFACQREDGAWPQPGDDDDDAGEREGYSMRPLQTALPLRGLAMCGYAEDARAERAYEWLLAQRLPDGAWPTGIAGGNYGRVAGYRRLAHSRWGCRSNTTGALLCLAHHPRRRHGEEARRALDLLLGRETREEHTLGFEVARLVGAEPARGFLTYFARYDLAQVLDLCWRVGAGLGDERVADVVAFVKQQQGARGLWQYGAKPQASHWVTFDLLRSLSRLDEAGDWSSLEPRTPFRAYPRREKRY
ncbi:MAG: prenyltransferase/squalene oxidase repeat-containing protein [Anaerolineae bacterium]